MNLCGDIVLSSPPTPKPICDAVEPVGWGPSIPAFLAPIIFHFEQEYRHGYPAEQSYCAMSLRAMADQIRWAPKGTTTATKSRKWCFTMYYDKEPGADYFGDNWECDYLIVGKEICPETKREHYQGYVRFPNPRALTGVRKLFTHKVRTAAGGLGYPGHWTPCKGTETDNFNYCSKENNIVIEWGAREDDPDAAEDKHQGKRNDIKRVRELIQGGAGMKEVVETINSAQAIKIAETMLKYIEPGRSWMPEVIWLYGPTGTGKSKLAFELCPDAWVSGETGRWFEGYDAHEDVILDDFRGDFCKFHVLLRLLDRYPYRVEVKGASRQFLAKRIVITSCHPPHLAYGTRKDEDIRQLGRRIGKIIHLERLGVAWEQPGSEIGLEPSVRFVIPERGPEQEVGGNTTPTPATALPTPGGCTPTSYPTPCDECEGVDEHAITCAYYLEALADAAECAAGTCECDEGDCYQPSARYPLSDDDCIDRFNRHLRHRNVEEPSYLDIEQELAEYL